MNGKDLQGELDKKQEKLTIDTQLNAMSTNPVTNSAITTAINKKLDASNYVVDTSLDSTSNNPISNSVATQINAKVDNKPDKWDVGHSIEAILDDDNGLTLYLNNNLGEGISRQYIPLTKNGLATENFVNSSISTATATFRGTYNSVDELPTTGIDLNDYAFVKATDELGNTMFNRYKYTDKWEFEYTLNNSSFTQAQWDAINSGATQTLINKIQDKADRSDLNNYLPLSAGESKKLTGNLYTEKSIILNNTQSLKGKNSSGVSKRLIEVGSTDSVWINYENLGKTIVGGSAIHPFSDHHHVTDLGIETAAFNNIRGKTIYQNGKQVANTEDIPTELSKLTQSASYRTVTDTEKNTWNNKSDFSGDYNDLENKPTIPDVSSFITKNVNNLTNYTLSTGVGSKLDLSIDSSTYVMTLKLTNASGTVLDTKTVDLPLETMVVNASYDSTNKQITLTLQNGTTTSFSVADLISGLATQSALDTTNANVTKLSNNTTIIKNGNGGFGAGTGAYATFGGGAVGYGSQATGSASSANASGKEIQGGGAVGYGARGLEGAGAVGCEAHASQGGFAGGHNAQTQGGIQLGTGTNNTTKTLQVYDDNIYDADSHTGKFKNISLDGKDLQTTLNTLSQGAGEANVQSDWNVTDSSSDAYIKNKPTIPDVSGLAKTSDLNNYLPLSAGSSKPLTGILYANNGVRIASENYLRFAGEARFIVPSQVIRFGSSSDTNSDLLVMTSTYLRPSGNNTTLGNSSNQWKIIYGTTIYQNGKQVANAEDVVDKSTDQTIGGNKTFSNNIVAPIFKGDKTAAGIKISDGNEINFSSTTDTIFFGYSNRTGSTGVVSNYKFGSHGGSQETSMNGKIYCNEVYVDAGKNAVARKTALQTLYSGSATSGTITLSQNLASSSNDLIVFFWINDENIYQSLALPESTLYSINSSTYNLALRSTTATVNKTMTLHRSGANTLAIDSNGSNYITLKNIYRVHFS